MVLIVLIPSGFVLSQEPTLFQGSNPASELQSVDPTGTWRWEQQFGGNSITRQLVLRYDEDHQLTGIYRSIYPEDSPFRRRGGGSSEISNAKLVGDELTFEVTRKFGDNDFTTVFSCVIVDDQLAGFTRTNFGGRVRESEWMASKRVSDDASTSHDATVAETSQAEKSQAETNASVSTDEASKVDSNQNGKLNATIAGVDSGDDVPGGDRMMAKPGRVPSPGPEGNGPYQPLPILPGGIVVPLYPPDSPKLNQERIEEAEQYNMTRGVPGRIQSIVNIHNPSIEVHTVSPSMNTGAVVIVAAGGGHRTLNVGTEGADFVPYFYNYGINTVILRNRLRSDGYDPQTDAVNDAMQAIRLVRKHASQWGFDPNKIGIMGFSAGAELSAPAAVLFDKYDREQDETVDDPLADVSSRPDFVGIIYPGPTPFTRERDMVVPRNTPPAFIVCAGAGDRVHAIWAVDYLSAMLRAGIPNVEMHIYGNGYHPGTRGATGGLTYRNGTPMGTWPDRFIDWFTDLGFLNGAGVATKAAADTQQFVDAPPRPRGGPRGVRSGRRAPPRRDAARTAEPANASD